MALMAQDKKAKRGRLTFILLEAVGRAVIANERRACAGSRISEGEAVAQNLDQDLDQDLEHDP
jgi:3-dehydroquinate synthetase